MSELPKGQASELNYSGVQNIPGVYKHIDTGVTFITAEGDSGILQADALMSPNWRGAWERVGDVPSKVELLELQKQQAEKEKKETK